MVIVVVGEVVEVVVVVVVVVEEAAGDMGPLMKMLVLNWPPGGVAILFDEATALEMQEEDDVD